MAERTKDNPIPIEIRLHQASAVLEIHFTDGQRFQLSAEYLRVYSPSAAVRGHNPAQAVLQFGKKHVRMTAVEPVGHYAVKLVFSDGHDSGLYTWDYLYRLGQHQTEYWQDYLTRLQRAGKQREQTEAQ